MKFEWHLARRYFKGQRRDSGFLSFIKIMAIAGVAIGSAGLLIALSITHGFKSKIHNKVLGFAPDITITKFTHDPIFRTDTLLTYLQKFPQISRAQPIVTGQAMVQSSDEVTGVFVKGISKKGGVTQLENYITQGDFDLTADSNQMPKIVIGSDLANRIKTNIGDILTVYTVTGIPTPLDSPEIQQFKLSGIYETGIGRFDKGLIIVARKYAKQLFTMPGLYSSKIEIEVHDKTKVKEFGTQLGTTLPFPYFSLNIYEKYHSIFTWIKLQEQTIPFIIGVMIIVAAFNLIGTILMMVLERTRDIGILKTMGAQSKKIRSIFLLEGILVALVGLIIGVSLSLLFAWVQTQFQLIPLSQQNYYMKYVPVEPHALDFIIVISITFVLSALASWLPARIASKTDPLKVIAYGR